MKGSIHEWECSDDAKEKNAFDCAFPQAFGLSGRSAYSTPILDSPPPLIEPQSSARSIQSFFLVLLNYFTTERIGLIRLDTQAVQ